jgi:hypothetical protein
MAIHEAAHDNSSAVAAIAEFTRCGISTVTHSGCAVCASAPPRMLTFLAADAPAANAATASALSSMVSPGFGRRTRGRCALIAGCECVKLGSGQERCVLPGSVADTPATGRPWQWLFRLGSSRVQSIGVLAGHCRDTKRLAAGAGRWFQLHVVVDCTGAQVSLMSAPRVSSVRDIVV